METAGYLNGHAALHKTHRLLEPDLWSWYWNVMQRRGATIWFWPYMLALKEPGDYGGFEDREDFEDLEDLEDLGHLENLEDLELLKALDVERLRHSYMLELLALAETKVPRDTSARYATLGEANGKKAPVLASFSQDDWVESLKVIVKRYVVALLNAARGLPILGPRSGRTFLFEASLKHLRWLVLLQMPGSRA
ncbi:MAG: hypothetical protein RML47_03710 [Bacteroidota bacterium]|nr:hypothetical protein [Rhodothermia bacterium]MDW8285192.1 hypothetical protein [Bacteroidota bacterium]